MARLQGVAIGDKIVPLDSLDTYPTHEDFYGQGGYVVGNNMTFDNLTGGAITSDRRKIGQIVYLPSINKHYTFTTLNSPLSFYDLKPALPYEYIGSVISTNFVAKTNSDINKNFISSYVGFPDGNGNIWKTEQWENCSILGGTSNSLTKFPNWWWVGINKNTTIVGGSANYIDYANFSIIGGGLKNTLNNSYNVLVGGEKNTVINNWGFIGGGLENTIGAYSDGASIVGGNRNSISLTNSRGYFSFIGGGLDNAISGDFTSIVGGEGNTASGKYNFVGGGTANNSGGGGDVVVGGKNNFTASSSISNTTMLTVSYSSLNIHPDYVFDTKVRVYAGRIFEFLPGSSTSGNNYEGRVRIIPLNTTLEGFRTPRIPSVDLTSPPSTSTFGRFGHAYYFASRTTTLSAHLFITEPGANKVHLFRYDLFNANHRPQLVTTITPPESIPANSLFGSSIFYIDNRGNLEYTSTNAYNLLFIGAPGNDKVYVYKNDNNLFDSSLGSAPSTVFSYITALSGQPGSEFGYSIIAQPTLSLDGTLTNHPSAIYVAVGAPNYNRAFSSPVERTGGIRIYTTQPASDYSLTNRKFKPFYHSADIDSYNTLSIGNSTIQAGDRFGEILGGVLLSSLYGTVNKDLSSTQLRFYTSIPTANIKRLYKPGDAPNTIEMDYDLEERFYLTRDPNVFSQTLPYSGAKVEFVSGGGIEYGFLVGVKTTLTAYNESSYDIIPYGDFNLGFQSYAAYKSVIFEGPGRDITGIYSLNSIMSGSNGVGVLTKNNAYTLNTEYYGNVRDWEYNINCTKPRANNSATGLPYPGFAYTVLNDARGVVYYMAPYPNNVPIQHISNYGFQNFRIVTTQDSPGFSTIYYLSGNTLTYTNFAADIPGEAITTNIILGGENNTSRGKSSLIGGGTNNIIDSNVLRSAIIAGGSNSINTEDGSLVNRSFNLIGAGSNNVINDSDFSNILNGSNNVINKNCVHAGILGGTRNTILSGLSGVFVLGNSLSGAKSFTTYVNNLFASDHIQAKTKSFTIKHPTKEGKTLTYGSLESPYHGIRLTGFGKLIKGKCIVTLPEYICKLAKSENVNIQLTNYNHNKLLYVSDINLSNNTFTVKTDGIFKNIYNYEFFWSFTAIRQDVPELITET